MEGEASARIYKFDQIRQNSTEFVEIRWISPIYNSIKFEYKIQIGPAPNLEPLPNSSSLASASMSGRPARDELTQLANGPDVATPS
jgi:hypothetical protein